MNKDQQNLADHNGCEGQTLEERVGDEVIHYWWNGCAAPTEWYLIEGGGHTWPGGPAFPVLGHTTDDISASDLIIVSDSSPIPPHVDDDLTTDGLFYRPLMRH